MIDGVIASLNDLRPLSKEEPEPGPCHGGHGPTSERSKRNHYYYYACTWGYMGHRGNHRDRLANLTARESMECRLLTDT